MKYTTFLWFRERTNYNYAVSIRYLSDFYSTNKIDPGYYNENEFMQECCNCGAILPEKKKYPVFCKPACAQNCISKNNTHSRRTNKPTNFITPLELFKRDNGICGICENPVDFPQVSIDHIKPVSEGGQHSWDNVQLTHYICNVIRGKKQLDKLLDGRKSIQDSYLNELEKQYVDTDEEY